MRNNPVNTEIDQMIRLSHYSYPFFQKLFAQMVKWGELRTLN